MSVLLEAAWEMMDGVARCEDTVVILLIRGISKKIWLLSR